MSYSSKLKLCVSLFSPVPSLPCFLGSQLCRSFYFATSTILYLSTITILLLQFSLIFVVLHIVVQFQGHVGLLDPHIMGCTMTSLVPVIVISVRRPCSIHPCVGRHDQADSVHPPLLARQRCGIRQFQRHGEVAAVCRSGARTHHHGVEVARR